MTITPENIVVVGEKMNGIKYSTLFNYKEFISVAHDTVPEKLNFPIIDLNSFLDIFLFDYDDEWEPELYWKFFYDHVYEELKIKYPNLDEIVDHLKAGNEAVLTYRCNYEYKDELIKKEHFDFYDWACHVFSDDQKHCFVLPNKEAIESYIEHFEKNTKNTYPKIDKWIKEYFDIEVD